MKRITRISPAWFIPATCALALAACGSDDEATTDAGVSGNGGTPATGGTPAGGGNNGTGGTPAGGESVDVEGEITTATTWTAGNTYHLKSHVFVKTTLTIEAGTKIVGDAGTSLVITTDGKLDAQGTADAPIVFTSSIPAGSREAGDWGGVVLLGKAPINVAGGTEKIEGFPDGETRTTYGGSDAAHDCGTLKYARIEFAGFELAPDNELNGLSVGGCGTGTTIDYVQVHKGADDGVEVWGGGVQIRHILVTQTDDDGLDWDFGWVGGAQYVVIQQNALVGDNGIEADNQKDDNDAMPRSAPTIWNISLIGSNAEPGAAGKTQRGMTLRRGTAALLHNALITGFADAPYNIADASTVAQIDAGALALKNSILFDNANQNEPALAAEAGDDDDDGGYDDTLFATAADSANRYEDPQLGAPFDLAAPDFKPAAGSPALTGGGTPGAGFDAAGTFVGGVGETDWTAGWTDFSEN
jgi:hypothetical protein